MIPYLELRSAARAAGVPASTIERDYVQNWFLSGLFWDDLALKGGTAIRKAFIPDYRFSDDLDFTLTAPVGMDGIQSLVDAALEHTSAASKITLDEAKKIEEVQNGFVMALKFNLPGSPYGTVRLKLDFTRSERELIATELQARPLLHRYSDRCVATLRTYSLEEMASEKIRSLFERTRARDLYDVWYLLGPGKVDEASVRNILGKKFRSKLVAPDLEQVTGRRNGFRDAWRGSLAHQMKDVPEFDTVFDRVTSAVSRFAQDL